MAVQFERLTIGCKDLFKKHIQSPLSDHTFTNMFMWDCKYKFEYALIEGCLCVVSMADKPYVYYLQTNVEKGLIAEVLAQLNVIFPELTIRPTSQNQAQKVLHCDEKLYMKHCREWDDYVYLVKNFTDPQGKAFHEFRRQIRVCNSTHELVYKRMEGDLVQSSVDFCNYWFGTYPHADDTECQAIKILFKHFEELDVRGGVMLEDGEVVAFTFGELLDDDTVVTHIEKAQREVTGSYYNMAQQFLLNEFPDVTCVNREQDLGIPSLRRAKKSLHPIRMERKHVVHAR